MRGDHSVKMSYMQRDLSKSMTVDRTVSAMNNAMINMDINSPQGVAGAPNEKALLSLMEKTGFSMIQENGQRKYGGPPPGWDGPPPPRGCEIFVGKIPRDCYEDELVPIFTQIGKIYELRLMMDFSGSNRGYAFVMYINREDAKRAVKELNNFEIRKGRLLGVCKSVDNCRLFVGGIPKNKHREEILEEMSKVTEGVVDVIVYPSVTDKAKNRGFAFVEYESHRSAAMARRKLIPGRIQLWGHQIAVDWAEPETEVDEDVMLTVKILYIRNLMLSTSEERIAELCCKVLGKENVVERVKKMRDYAFVHFRDRDDATLAMDYLNGTNLEGSVIEVSYAKPVDKTDYLRITKNVGARALYTPGYGFQAYDASTFSSPTLYTTLPLAAARGFPMGMRTPIRGRGRLAAGSRGGAGRGYIPGMRMPYRHPADDARLFDLLPGMELTPTNPITLKPQNVKSPIQILDDFCQKNGWGSPMYQLNSTPGRDGTQLFVYKVTVPVLNTNPFCPNKLCRTPDDSKLYAAQYVLAQLGVPYEGGDHATLPPSPPAAAAVIGAAAAVPTSPYQQARTAIGSAYHTQLTSGNTPLPATPCSADLPYSPAAGSATTSTGSSQFMYATMPPLPSTIGASSKDASATESLIAMAANYTAGISLGCGLGAGPNFYDPYHATITSPYYFQYPSPPGDYNRPAYAAAAAAYTPSGYSSHGAPVELYQQYQ